MPLVDDRPQCPGDGCQDCDGCRAATQDPTDLPSPRVSIKLAGNGLGTVRLGDTDISSFVSAVTITAAAGQHLQASLRVFVDEMDAQDAEIHNVIQHLLASQPAHVENVVAELLRTMYFFVPLSVCDEAARAAREILAPWIKPTSSPQPEVLP